MDYRPASRPGDRGIVELFEGLKVMPSMEYRCETRWAMWGLSWTVLTHPSDSSEFGMVLSKLGKPRLGEYRSLVLDAGDQYRYS
jgi:hypothetical protein